MFNAIDLGEYFKIPSDNRNLNYQKYEIKGNDKLIKTEEYNSSNTKRLNKTEMKKLLKKLDLFMEDK